jgi:lysophospholipase L1-like esterase
VACGGKSSASDQPSGQGGDAATSGDDGASPVADAGNDADPLPAPVTTSTTFGTYIVLGDSISAGGGQGPFFYDLLHQNDDTTYPGWQGHDLSTRFPGIQYVHAAVAGSITGAYGDTLTTGAPLMTTQIAGLGTSYPGDILVTITIGGNDLNDHAGDAILGLDSTDKTKFAANLKADLDTLLTPGRLGTGKVWVLEANIYDSSDGQGNFMSKGGAQCPPFNVSSTQDATAFGDWNAIITAAVSAHASEGDYLWDIHSLFAGHGFNSTDSWYYVDCIHPNQKGHDQLRREAWHMITGEDIQD